jgi:6-pyruvoyl-tetrahydropterin synthase
MYRANARFSFFGSHYLYSVYSGDSEAEPHIHHFEITLHAEAGKTGRAGVIHPETRDEFSQWIEQTLSNRDLNVVLSEEPILENIAAFCFRGAYLAMPELISVSVDDGAISCEYAPETEERYKIWEDLSKNG